jgi:HK97 family phage major capsid protein
MANLQEIIDLKQKRANNVKQFEEIMNRAKEEKRDLHQDEETILDRIHAEERDIAKKIERLEFLEEGLKRQAEDKGFEQREEQRQKPEHREAFKKWITGGIQSLTQEERNLMFNHRAEERALSATTGAAGGFTVPQGFYNELIDAMKWFGGMRNVANVFQTDSGNALPIPTANDTSNVGAILAENTQAASTPDVPFGQVTLNAYKYTSNIVLVPIELLQDSAFDIESYLARKLGERIGRINNTHFTVGTGSSQPQGVVTGAVSGKVGLTGQTTSVIYDDLIDLEHSVDIAYRPNAKYMLNDQSLKAIKKLKDSQGRPLWLPGLAFKEPDTINGYGYQLNNDVAQMAANAKSILFGDYSNYFIRDVKNIAVVRFNEKYMDAGQVGFVAFSRADGKLVNAGMNPVAYYQNSAT